MPNLTSYDLNIVRKQLASLPPQIEAAKTHEMGEMMGKLKEVRVPEPDWRYLMLMKF